mmetsp:Transcript_78652/g.204271  ORF Transcript_78652/g.204271 Transcript_78652/m.204271 type:complete len:218 (-) Transcript_78652:616-1269(-)
MVLFVLALFQAIEVGLQVLNHGHQTFEMVLDIPLRFLQFFVCVLQVLVELENFVGNPCYTACAAQTRNASCRLPSCRLPSAAQARNGLCYAAQARDGEEARSLLFLFRRSISCYVSDAACRVLVLHQAILELLHNIRRHPYVFQFLDCVEGAVKGLDVDHGLLLRCHLLPMWCRRLHQRRLPRLLAVGGLLFLILLLHVLWLVLGGVCLWYGPLLLR